MPKLVGRIQGTLHQAPLAPEGLILGREPSCALTIDSPQVSRQHCRIDLRDGTPWVVDMASTNGTFLNGRRVSRVSLEVGDRLRVGDSEWVLAADDEDPQRALDRPPRRWADPKDQDTWFQLQLPSLEAANLELQDQRRTALQERVLKLSRDGMDAVSEDEVRALLGEIVSELVGFTRAHWGTVLLQPPDGGPLESMTDDPSVAWDRQELRRVVGDAVATHGPIVREFLGADDDPRTAICLPLDTSTHDTDDAFAFSERRLRTPGALLLVAPPGAHLHEHERTLLELVAAQATLALQRVWLFRQASVDHLTQLSNRARIERLLEAELQRARVTGDLLAVVLFDLDHFKRINDTHGHPMGDEVLREVSRRARSVLRQGDPIGRWGGEEFLVILPRSGSTGAHTVSDKISAAISSTPIGDPQLHVTVSAGIASFPVDGRDSATLLRNADLALYAAKEAGRNQTQIFRADMIHLGELEQGGSTLRVLREEVFRDPEQQPWVLDCPPFDPVPMRGRRLTIGRDPECDLILPHSEVSRLHAVLVFADGSWRLEDRGSVNGTFVNGLRVDQPVELGSGDQIRIDPYALSVGEAGRPGKGDTRKRLEVYDLEVTPLGQIVAPLAETPQTVTLVVHAGEALGSIRYMNGGLDTAQFGELSGQHALEALLTLRHGTCYVSRVSRPTRPPTSTATTAPEA